VPAHPTEGLPHPPCLVLEPAAMGVGEPRQQPAIEPVAIAGDPRQQFGERQAGLPGAGAVPRQARRHQHHSGQHGRRLPAEVGHRHPFAVAGGIGLWPGEDAVERGLLHDHAAVVALGVDPRRVPEAEEIVGTAGRRMEKVEGPGIDRQFLEQFEVEVGLLHEFRRRVPEDVDRAGNEPAVAAVGRTGAGDVERHGPHPFVTIRLRQPPVLQHGHRSPADVIVEPVDRAGRGLGKVVATARRRQHGLRGRHHEVGPLQAAWRLMLQEVGVEPVVARQHMVEHGIEHPAGLRGVAKGGLGGLERSEPRGECRRQPRGRVGGFDDGTIGIGQLEPGVQVAAGPPGGWVKGPRRKVQVAQDERRGVRGTGRLHIRRHRGGVGIAGSGRAARPSHRVQSARA